MKALRKTSLLTLLSLLSLYGCQLESPVLKGADPDFDYFVCAVQPILARECSMPACHGNSKRHFQVLASGRMRIAEEYQTAKSLLTIEELHAGNHPQLTYGELAFNYYQALSFAQITQGFTRSQLITRPLAIRAGGMAHAPRADVYFEDDDPRIEMFEAWISGATTKDCP